ncbi:hypothetical protein KBZ20_17255, partial [Vulcanococcus limneticus Candia 3F8]|uniref:hypothetical protein n=2 Tax=Vulcanococcus limneticus TaxID=2170428 RepID=UPI0020CF9C0B
VLSLRMICSAVCLVRFMVESPAQSGRMRTLIHPGPVSGVHVTVFQKRGIDPGHDPQPPELQEQLRLLGLDLVLILGVLASGAQLAGIVEQRPPPLADLDRVDGVVGDVLLDGLAATDRFMASLARTSGLSRTTRPSQSCRNA